MNEKKSDAVYSFLKENEYSFRKIEKKQAAKFSSYNEAFNAAFDLSNSSLDISVGQDNKIVYFSDKLIEKPYVEAREDDGHITYSGIVMSFSMFLDWNLNLDIKKKIGKTTSFFKGNADKLYSVFMENYSDQLNVVEVEKRRNGLLIKKS